MGCIAAQEGQAHDPHPLGHLERPIDGIQARCIAGFAAAEEQIGQESCCKSHKAGEKDETVEASSEQNGREELEDQNHPGRRLHGGGDGIDKTGQHLGGGIAVEKEHERPEEVDQDEHDIGRYRLISDQIADLKQKEEIEQADQEPKVADPGGRQGEGKPGHAGISC